MLSEPAPKKKRGRPRKNPAVDIQQGQSLGPVKRITTGNLGQRDVESYDVLDALGQIVGKVLVSASTSIKPPFKTSYSMVQTDIAGTVIVQAQLG
jgi:hypothetical protein